MVTIDDASQPRLGATDDRPRPRRDWQRLDDVETRVAWCFILYVEVYILAVLSFGYAGAIVVALASAATMLVGIVVVTATGLR